MRSSVEETLEARGKTYGDFMLGTSTEALILQALMNNHEANCKKKLNPLHVIWLTKIIQKLVRLSVTPDHSDSYRDIAGYASLILAEIQWNEMPCKDHGMLLGKDIYTSASVKIRQGSAETSMHGLACEKQHGSRPKGCEASHLCHNKRCIEPSHLVWETHAGNALRNPVELRRARYLAGRKTLGPEKISALAKQSNKKANETLGAEGRSARQKKAHANRTPERRSEIAIKSRNTRGTNAKS